MKRDLFAEVSGRILAELERGAAPWVKPWSATAGANVPCNAATNRPYSGCNVILLWMAQAAGYRTPRFLTYRQAAELGAHVRRGEKGHRVYFVKQLQVRDKDAADGEEDVVGSCPVTDKAVERPEYEDGPSHGVEHDGPDPSWTSIHPTSAHAEGPSPRCYGRDPR